MSDKDLSHLKSDRLNMRCLADTYPRNKKYQIDYEKAKREVQAREREAFCDEVAK